MENFGQEIIQIPITRIKIEDTVPYLKHLFRVIHNKELDELGISYKKAISAFKKFKEKLRPAKMECLNEINIKENVENTESDMQNQYVKMECLRVLK